MRRNHFLFKCGGLALFFLTRSFAPAAESTGYFGPLETLDNGNVTLQVSLKIGRVVSYHRKGENNWLAVNEKPPVPEVPWNVWGGDRIWPSEQSQNEKIYRSLGADPVIDGQPWELLEKTPSSLKMKSRVSPFLGLQIIRKIELIPGSNEVIHSIRLERLEENPYPVQAWAVTGIRSGDFILMEADARGVYPENMAFKWWRDVSPEIPSARLLKGTRFLEVLWPQKKLKVGSYGRWIAVVSADSAFQQTIEYEPGSAYPDASNLQAYLDRQYAVYEIETLSPSWSLKKGETREWKVRWKLVDFPEGMKTNREKGDFLAGEAER